MLQTLGDGRYEVLRSLGQGGVGIVYEAHDTLLDRRVAIKCLRAPFSAQPRLRERFERECRILSGLSHPHIVEIHDVDVDEEGSPFLVMALIDGEDALRWAARQPDAVAAACRIGRQTCSALAHTHAAGVVHRDLKPANLLVDADGNARLTDFGLARSAVEETLTSTDEVVGTFLYLAPEQTRTHRVDARADLYALGVLLYTMACGRPPYTFRDPQRLLSEIVAGTTAPPSTHNPAVPEALDRILLGLLQRDPDKRPRTADAVLHALDDIPA